jgi:plastocyanin
MRNILVARLCTALLCIALSAAAGAADHVITQNSKAFSTTALNAKVGDTLSFRNDDPFVHNIFSLSDVQTFDLGTFAKGEVRQVKLTKPGKLEIECAVHPEMKLVVEVK